MSNFLDFRGYRIPEVLVGKTGGGASAMARFAEISDWHVSQLDSHIGINAADNIVEIGCGIGRVAIPLTERLTKGSYIGTDTIEKSIQWCVENISSTHMNFKFIHHDIHDELHNPNGSIHAHDIILPSEDESVDLIILHSVFTHMFRDEVTHYLKEFKRILKPSGRVWASFFIANAEMLKLIDAGQSTSWGLSFQHRLEDGDRAESEASPRAAVLYEELAIEDMSTQSGLAVDLFLQGTWSGLRDNPKNGQDALIFRRADIQKT